MNRLQEIEARIERGEATNADAEWLARRLHVHIEREIGLRRIIRGEAIEPPPEIRERDLIVRR